MVSPTELANLLRAAFTQADRLLRLETPLGPNALLPEQLDAAEHIDACNDPVKPAQVRRLKRTPQPEFSSSAPDGAVDGCRTESNQRSRGWHAAAFRSDDDARIAP